MPPKPKTELQRLQLHNTIINAARDLFISEGVEAVTMRQIASRIGYSATSIYSHFADKESLLRAICDTDFLALATKQQSIFKIADPVERMMALGTGYAEFALTHPNHYRIMFMTPHAPTTPEQSALQHNNPEQDAYFQLKIVVDEVLKAGKFRPELTDAELISQTIWAAMHGVCALQITMAQDTWVKWCDISARLTMMQKMVMQGLLKAPIEES